MPIRLPPRSIRTDGDPTGCRAVRVSIPLDQHPQVVVEAHSSYLDSVKAASAADRLVHAFTDERAP